MFDFQPAPSRVSLPEYSVTELSLKLKGFIEDNFSLVKVRGEISGLKIASSGHVYFNLKDEQSVLAGIIWRSGASGLNFKLEEGAEVICTGKLTTYPGRSNYQIIVSFIQPAGVGALLAMLEARKKKFEQMGLFAASRKRALPKYPRVIGVVTSPTGAVIRDIIHRISERFPLQVVVWPVLVQGPGAAEQIAAAIDGFNNMPASLSIPDVIIVARGGGSIEDLWAFNEENVVMAAANSKIPLVSAVGHETDTTLIDFVADVRAPTPTAAAEICTPVFSELKERLRDLSLRSQGNVLWHLDSKAELLARSRNLVNLLDLLARKLQQRLERSSSNLQRLLTQVLFNKSARIAAITRSLNSSALLLKPLERSEAKLALLENRLQNAIKSQLNVSENRLILLSKLLESYHYKRVLERGYAIVRDDAQRPITRKIQVAEVHSLNIEFADGVLEVKVQV